jgi:hypothetical protein
VICDQAARRARVEASYNGAHSEGGCLWPYGATQIREEDTFRGPRATAKIV